MDPVLEPSTPADIRLKRFLHYGNETSIYIPQGRNILIKFEPENVPSIATLLSSPNTENHVVPLITKAAADGYSVEPYALIYALATCVRKGKPLIKNAAYKALRKLAEKSEYFLVFTYYLRNLAIKDGCKGFGKGWRYTVEKWYNSKDALKLAEIVLEERCIMKWSHKDIIRLSHLSVSKFEDEGKYALIHYILFDYQSAVEKYGKQEKAKPVLEYIKTVEEMKSTTNIKTATDLIAKNKFTINFCSTSSLKSPEIWIELIQQMDVGTIIKYVNRLSRLRILRNPKLLKIILQKFEKDTNDLTTNVHPAWVYIMKKTYELAPDFALTFEYNYKRSIQQAAGNVGNYNEIDPSENPTVEGNQNNNGDNPQEVGGVNNENLGAGETNEVTKRTFEPITSIVNNLSIIASKAFLGLAPTGLRYLIALDTRPVLQLRSCYYSRFVTVHEAITLISLCILKTESESNVKLVTLQTPSLNVATIEFNKVEESIDSFIRKTYPNDGVEAILADESMTLVGSKIIDWATDQSEKYDVIIMLSDHSLVIGNLNQAFTKYTTAVSPNAKLITCCLTGPPKKKLELTHPNMFLICGFDDKVCRLIEAFSRGAF